MAPPLGFRHHQAAQLMSQLRKLSRLVSQSLASLGLGFLALASGIARLAALVATWHESSPRSHLLKQIASMICRSNQFAISNFHRLTA
jgi:hypothetical protein